MIIWFLSLNKNMITIDEEVNCLGCKNSEVYICSNTMQDLITCKVDGKPDRYSGCHKFKKIPY